jgi:hypothetical protein
VTTANGIPARWQRGLSSNAKPLFPDNNLHAALDAKVSTVKYYSSDLTLRGAKKDLTLDEAIATGASYESGPSRLVSVVSYFESRFSRFCSSF